MAETSVTHNTFVIERSYPTTPERVFAAFADPAKKHHWFTEGKNQDGEQFEMDFRVGGIERSSFRITEGPLKGAKVTNDTVYQDIVTNRRIVSAYTMTVADNRISASLTTFEFVPTAGGTDLIFTHQGAFFEGADGPRMREGGWQRLLDHLSKELTR